MAPPTPVLFGRTRRAVHSSYRRFLENRLRETFGFDGTPIRLVFRDRTSVDCCLAGKTTRRAPVATARGRSEGPSGGPERRAAALIGRSAGRGRRGRGVGHDPRRGSSPAASRSLSSADGRRSPTRSGGPAETRPGYPSLPGDGRRHRRPGRPGRCDRPRHLRDPVPAPSGDGGAGGAAPVGRGGHRVGGQGPRGREPAPDERGDRRGGKADPGRLAALSGPNLALEIARGLPASAVIASTDPECGPARRRPARPAGVPVS